MEADSLSRDLNGAFGDLAWALGLSPGPDGPQPPCHILIPADESEMAHQRLLLAGYQPNGGENAGRSKWTTPDGGQILVLESVAPWVREALALANRNRDRVGTPRLTAVFELVVRMHSEPAAGDEIFDRWVDAELVVAARRILAVAEIENAVASESDIRRLELG